MYGPAALFGALWIESIQRFIKWAAFNHVGGFNGSSGAIFNFLNSDIANFFVSVVWVIAILYYIYTLKGGKNRC
jgi:hypothetical protein